MIKNMNSKVSTNSHQQLNLEKKTKQKETKQPTRIGTESQKWRSHRRLSMGMGGGRIGEKVQEIRSINGRHKIRQGRLRIV